MESVTRTVELAIAAELPEHFGLIFDGWSHDSEHYIGVFAWLNRAVSVYLAEHSDDLDLVQSLMLKLRTLNQSAKLRYVYAILKNILLVHGSNCISGNLCGCSFKTDLRPIIRQQNRWGSTFAMLHRNFELLPFIDADDDELADLLPSAAAERRLRKLYDELKDVESVSKALQGSEVNLLDLLERIFVNNSDFEAGCVKVLKGQSARLSRAEKAALQPFLATSTSEEDDDDDEGGASFVERLQKRRRLDEQQPMYELLTTIPPTSNVVERLFSTARTTVGQQRHGLQPYTLEMLLFLRQNADYWDARTVESVE
ncbi:hypothetical protein BBJ28_00007143 [Nothophytophthora sp. Chile5]|nr:hypothetical protein BBJ28_00007143 [Nothophytophthora sp. Chile5]